MSALGSHTHTQGENQYFVRAWVRACVSCGFKLAPPLVMDGIFMKPPFSVPRIKDCERHPVRLREGMGGSRDDRGQEGGKEKGWMARG